MENILGLVALACGLIVGLGAIGQRFARMCDAMGMQVIGFDPYAQDLPQSIRQVDLATLWRESDVISLHCPLTEENRNLVNAQTLQACKRGIERAIGRQG